ncbi:MAG TPA: hypothetical protein VEL47_05365, partial [Myxococcota bacterium]|nr:hypothetical protein [Myxococcota bacterium]
MARILILALVGLILGAMAKAAELVITNATNYPIQELTTEGPSAFGITNVSLQPDGQVTANHGLAGFHKIFYKICKPNPVQVYCVFDPDIPGARGKGKFGLQDYPNGTKLSASFEDAWMLLEDLNV